MKVVLYTYIRLCAVYEQRTLQLEIIVIIAGRVYMRLLLISHHRLNSISLLPVLFLKCPPRLVVVVVALSEATFIYPDGRFVHVYFLSFYRSRVKINFS